MAKRVARVDRSVCVSCGACAKACPRGAVQMYRGLYARILLDRCVGCGLCAKVCPASVISVGEANP